MCFIGKVCDSYPNSVVVGRGGVWVVVGGGGLARQGLLGMFNIRDSSNNLYLRAQIVCDALAPSRGARCVTVHYRTLPFKYELRLMSSFKQLFNPNYSHDSVFRRKKKSVLSFSH